MINSNIRFKAVVRAALAVMLLVVTHSPLTAQILTVDPDEAGYVVDRAAHVGLTLAGTSGLITMPTPDIKKEGTWVVSYKGGVDKQNVTYGNTVYNIQKNEHYTALAYNLSDKLEFSLNHLDYSRCSDPVVGGLNYPEEMTAYGLKYSTWHGKQDLCMGVNFAPMTSAQQNRADINQIEYMRNIYLTITEDIADDFRGYMNVKNAFTADQKVTYGNNQELIIPRTQLIISGLGFEGGRPDRVAVIGEVQWFNCRDIYTEYSIRHSFNAGLRGGNKYFQAEVFGLSLNQDPRVVFGVNCSY